jgi:hypothetical protein
MVMGIVGESNMKNIIKLLSLAALTWLFASCGNRVEVTEKPVLSEANSQLPPKDDNSKGTENQIPKATGEQIKISWDKNDSQDLTAYKLFAIAAGSSEPVKLIEEILVSQRGFNPDLPSIAVDPSEHPVLKDYKGKETCFHLYATNPSGESEKSDDVCIII